MPRRAPATKALPRRTPRRQVGQNIVEAILESATQLLVREGYSALSTNRIAELAGVSIGSLYQYFPGKQAVIAALARRLEYRALEIFAKTIDALSHESVRKVAHSLIVDLAGERLGALAARREILREVPRAWTEEASREVDELVTDGLAQHLASRADVRPGNHRVMALIVTHAVEAVLEAAVLRHPDLLAEPEFLRELAELPARYLARDPVS
jgi:AcrR family transcriptional regulator